MYEVEIGERIRLQKKKKPEEEKDIGRGKKEKGKRVKRTLGQRKTRRGIKAKKL
jgi:hypothetical protein